MSSSAQQEKNIALMEAIKKKDVAAFDAALAAGADINAVETTSYHPMLGIPGTIKHTPLKVALSTKDMGMITKVLEAGADLAKTKEILGKEFIAELVDGVPTSLQYHPESTQKLRPIINLFLALGEPADPLCEDKRTASTNLHDHGVYARAYEKTPQMATTWHARVVGAADELTALGCYLKDIAAEVKPRPAFGQLASEDIPFDIVKRQESLNRLNGTAVETDMIVAQGQISPSSSEIAHG